MTTKVNQEDMTTSEDIETVKNTTSASSMIPLKTEHRDQEDFLPSTSGIQVREEIIYNGRDLITESVTTFFSPVIEVEDDSVVNTVVENNDEVKSG